MPSQHRLPTGDGACSPCRWEYFVEHAWVGLHGPDISLGVDGWLRRRRADDPSLPEQARAHARAVMSTFPPCVWTQSHLRVRRVCCLAFTYCMQQNPRVGNPALVWHSVLRYSGVSFCPCFWCIGWKGESEGDTISYADVHA